MGKYLSLRHDQSLSTTSRLAEWCKDQSCEAQWFSLFISMEIETNSTVTSNDWGDSYYLKIVFSCASAKAERSLSSLYGVFLYVELGGTPPAKISRVQTKMLHHFCMTPNLPMSAKFYGCKL